MTDAGMTQPDAPATPLRLSARTLDSSTVVTVEGELDATNSAVLDAYVADVHPRGEAALILDLTAMTFLDSSGLHLLTRLHVRAEERGGALHLAAPHERVRRLLAITGTDRLLTAHDTLGHALLAAGLIAGVEPRDEPDSAF
ncbi:STAS domain-containing protein [Nonomuraea sp. NBC_01738]|uniref:STAS domain-containing protein n=1 Tax=Nonomuraea sp. NBC_01738 TaxID=2976003 RepID=UPI002E165AE3|nr:STAS domain-containing protein [Nonomuraea sp. NBC_01738]